MHKLALISIIIIGIILIFKSYIIKNYSLQSDKTSKIISESIKKIGVEKTYQSIIEKHRNEPSECYDLLHRLGEEVFRLYQRNDKFQMPINTYDCDSGFYQGIYDSFQNKYKNQVKLQSLCNFLNSRTIPKTWDQCFFNMGHIFVAKERIGKKDESEIVESSLAPCESYAQRKESRSDCVTGIFDTINEYYQTGKYGFKMDPVDPLNLCIKQNDEYRVRCYVGLVSSLYQMSKYDLTRAFQYLESIKDRSEKSDIMATLASTVAWRDRDYKKMAQRCKRLDLQYQLSCITGYAGGLLETSKYGEEYKEALIYCQNELFTDIEKKACIKRLFTDYEVLYPGKANGECKVSVESKFKEICENFLKR